MVIRSAAWVDPAGTKGEIHDLRWEVSASVWANQTTAAATAWEGCKEVSRGRSSQWELTKGRIFYGKEQAERLDGCGATARHVDPAEPL
jgi:hypothetical protein